jgi:hypothetical protein
MKYLYNLFFKVPFLTFFPYISQINQVCKLYRDYCNSLILGGIDK